jgi:acetyl-CoA carboxylase carboxyl transferase subunit alpha
MAVDTQFEEPLSALRRRIEELERFSPSAEQLAEAGALRGQLEQQSRETYAQLNRWERTLVARHPERPYALDYIHGMTSDWVEIHGDRRFGDDPAIVAGLAKFGARSVVIIGHQKGRTTKERVYRNFGQPRPEGYRKALRAMQLAGRFGLPILTLIDTPGAFPGIEGEERGQAEAIARNLIEMAVLPVPILVTVTGEGGSGGALAVGVGDRVLMLEHSVYSVISPEGCAAILWKDSDRKAEAAEAMRLTAPDLLQLGVIDEVIPEPAGGAHADPEAAIRRVAETLDRTLGTLEALDVRSLLDQRYGKFRRLGVYSEGGALGG